ncbi:TVP38/TMEM64 family protein [Mycobacterium sp.]|uniref:TVP38/TMEM64 family protein n=1 Tax=Mycobacterium sp. TaxID=1785 RepID=UPI003BA96948
MTAPAIDKTTYPLRGIAAAGVAMARQASRPRAFGAVVGITALAAVALLVDLPTAVQLRDWATSVGPWFPLAFLLVHVVVTVVPLPRTAFTLAAGLLFGPVLGVSIAVIASTGSAVIAMLLMRAAGWRLTRMVRHRAVGSLDERLRERGWLAVLSLRLIPAVPFAVLNYAAGASAVRVAPYALSTLAGLIPGTAAVAILGDALSSNGNPKLILISLCTATLGLIGLIVEIRHYRRHHQSTPVHDPPIHEPAVAH